jgi:hypothetical protein
MACMSLWASGLCMGFWASGLNVALVCVAVVCTVLLAYLPCGLLVGECGLWRAERVPCGLADLACTLRYGLIYPAGYGVGTWLKQPSRLYYI